MYSGANGNGLFSSCWEILVKLAADSDFILKEPLKTGYFLAFLVAKNVTFGRSKAAFVENYNIVLCQFLKKYSAVEISPPISDSSIIITSDSVASKGGKKPKNERTSKIQAENDPKKEEAEKSCANNEKRKSSFDEWLGKEEQTPPKVINIIIVLIE